MYCDMYLCYYYVFFSSILELVCVTMYVWYASSFMPSYCVHTVTDYTQKHILFESSRSLNLFFSSFFSNGYCRIFAYEDE